jgi:hypothetical protein
MASAQRVIDWFQQWRQKGVFEHTKTEYDKIEAQQHEEEKMITEKYSFPCVFPQLKDRYIDTTKIQSKILEGIFDSQVLYGMMCANNTITMLPDRSIASANIRRYFSNLRRIGGESAEGIAMTASVETDDNKPFVVKTSKKNDALSVSVMLHEYFIGVFGTNTLRSQIPNFAYIYGIFKCSPPFIQDSTQQVTSYCQNEKEQVNYVLYENIQNTQTLRKMITTGLDINGFLEILTQLVLSEELAYQRFDYTHRDLHTENVLIKTLKEPIVIEYPTKHGKVYLRTKYIAYIIDQGRAHIQVDGRHFGYSLANYVISPNESYPMYDIYKIVMGCLNDANGQIRRSNPDLKSDDSNRQMINKSLFMALRQLINYWTKEENDINYTTLYLIDVEPYYYSLPSLEEFKGSLLPFFKYMKQQFPTIETFTSSVKYPSISIYGCLPNNNCMTFEKGLEMFTMKEDEHISDPYVFADVLIKNSNIKGTNQSRLDDSKVNLYNRVLISGRKYYIDYLSTLIRSINVLSQHFYKLEGTIAAVSIQNNIYSNLQFSKTVMDLYRTFVDKAVECITVMTDVSYEFELVKLINEAYPDLAAGIDPVHRITYTEYTNKLYQKLKPSVDKANRWIKIIKDDQQWLQKQKLTSHDSVKFYNKLNEFTLAIDYINLTP